MRKAIVVLILFLCSASFCFALRAKDLKHALLQNNTDSEKYVDLLNRRAMLMYETNVDSTFYYTTKARKIAERIGYKQGKADALNNLGIFFDIKGNSQMALRYYNAGYMAYQALKDSSNLAQATMNIAMVYGQMGRHGKAVQYFDYALNHAKKLSKDSILSLVIYNYLLAYPDKFKQDSTTWYINKVKEIASKYKDKRVLVAIEQLVGDQLILAGERQKGLKVLDSTISLALKERLYYVSMDMFIDIGDQLLESDSDRAVAYYKKGLGIASKNGYLIYSELLAEKLFNFYNAKGDNLTASIYSRQLLNFHGEKEKLHNSSEVDYLDYALKEKEVDALTLKSKYQTASLILAVLVIILALVVLFVITRNLKRTRQLNSQVLNQNNIMKDTLNSLELSQADNSKMIKMAAHDLRNPLGGIFSLTEIMLNKGDYAPGDLHKLELIKRASENSLSVVSDMLQFQSEKIQKKTIDLQEMLQYCISILDDKAKAKRQQLNLFSEHVLIQASSEKLWRVMSNLISNSIKFSPFNSEINIRVILRGKDVEIQVEDKGVGIPIDLQDKIFDMETAAKRVGTAGEISFGYGLAISKQIVEAHGGKIWLKSNEEEGATFFVSLPIN